MRSSKVLRVGILHDSLTDTKVDKRNPHGFVQVGATVQAVKDAIKQLEWEPVLIPVGHNLISQIHQAQVDIVFNIATGIGNKNQQANVVAMLELAKIPFTGSGLRTHILGIHKEVAKYLFKSAGIPTPAFQVFITGQEELDPKLRFPLIVKPSSEGSSMGITENSVVQNKTQLYEQINHLLTVFNEPVLVEEFIEGREFTIGILGNQKTIPLPIEEIIFQNKFYSYEVKERDAVKIECPARLRPELALKMLEAAQKAYRLLDCAGYARIDLRLDAEENFYFLEINTLPGIQPGYSEIPRMAEVLGLDFPALVRCLIELGLERFGAQKLLSRIGRKSLDYLAKRKSIA
ncbi:hypothetical protein BBF96_05345 [Anoxybacter fermentans]|uniref:ATP-grasp domain-containing protein n=1 Tax=Anoxybacter fermentans TaxID=1323375 RepID=A0A3S9SXC9_9FIRM|nr:ATP-grasp domain-containing protein [Anoxybacter fermentans]AZR72864.1 hypothetical protein BBF96_05345 [Anoxybacter fermentans]